ncbi:MAG: MoaD/ThiS family protein [Planctomycetales bacterium]|nr:MoaD/ThiS family protein [Planctomycetales bacterium]
MTPLSSPTPPASDWLHIDVRLFAAAADLAAARQLRLHVPAGCSLSDLIDQLLERFPTMSNLAHVSRWAVDEQFVPTDFIIDRDLAIAMIPPVSGG